MGVRSTLLPTGVLGVDGFGDRASENLCVVPAHHSPPEGPGGLSEGWEAGGPGDLEAGGLEGGDVARRTHV